MQEVGNGKPEKYERKGKATLKEAFARLEKIFSQYPPTSPEVIEAHRRLGYPEHFIQSLETGDYKIMTEPPLSEDGTKDWRAFEQFWSFDQNQVSNIQAHRSWDNLRDKLANEFASGRGFRSIPKVDLKALADATHNIPDFYDLARKYIDFRTSKEVVVDPKDLDSLWAEYNAAYEDSTADAINAVCDEKEIEVRYVRRNALIQWMQARGDLDHWDYLDMVPKHRDAVLGREDEHGFYLAAYNLPPVEESSAQQMLSWNDFKEILRAQRIEWHEADEQAALGGAVTEEAELQRRIDSIMSKDTSADEGDSDKSASGEAGKKKKNISAELVSNQEKIEKAFFANMSSDINRLPLAAQALMRNVLGSDYQEKWKEAHDGFVAKQESTATDAKAAE